MPWPPRAKGAPHGSVFFADEQTAGRGRGDHAWHSAAGPGAVCQAWCCDCRLRAARLPLIPLAAGLGRRRGDSRCERTDCRSALAQRSADRAAQNRRHPGGNANGFGSAGVRCCGHRHQRASARFDPGLATPATSLDLESGRWIERQPLLIALLESLEREARALIEPAAARGHSRAGGAGFDLGARASAWKCTDRRPARE